MWVLGFPDVCNAGSHDPGLFCHFDSAAVEEFVGFGLGMW